MCLPMLPLFVVMMIATQALTVPVTMMVQKQELEWADMVNQDVMPLPSCYRK